MRVLVAGGTGVIGRQLVPVLSNAGHEVFVIDRFGDRIEEISGMGGRPVVGDVLRAETLTRVMATSRPDAVVHMATAIPAALNPRKLAAQFETTNLLRTVGTANLLAACESAGIDRFIGQGLAYAYDPSGEGKATEIAPLWSSPPRQFAPVLAALRIMERQIVDAGGLVLRIGHLYGPRSSYSRDGSFAAQVVRRKVPLVDGGSSVFSFTHARDVATAVLAALDKDASGVLNIVDDQPVAMHDWLPTYAHMLGAPPPKSASSILARLAVGGWGLAFMTELRGADNGRAKAELDWRPRYGDWRSGFSEELECRSAAAELS